MADDYRFTSLKDIENIAKYSVTGLGMSLLANRISWFFNFGGPSINFDSACSSSLMALDVACQGLRNGDSSMVSIPPLSSFMHIDLFSRLLSQARVLPVLSRHG